MHRQPMPAGLGLLATHDSLSGPAPSFLIARLNDDQRQVSSLVVPPLLPPPPAA